MLELRNVSWSNGRGFAVQNVHMRLERGKVTCLMGPNGAGKSTLLKLMTGEVKPDDGQALLGSRAVSEYPRREFARRVAVIRQERSFAFSMKCRELVMTGRTPYLGFMGRSGAGEMKMAEEALDRCGAHALMDAPFDEISGGEKQRVMLARALMQEPEALLLDEAFSAMDMRQSVRAMRLVRELSREREMAVLCIVHDIHLAHAFADRIVLMEDGRITEDGLSGQVIESEAMRRLTGMQIAIKDGQLIAKLEEE